MSKELATKSCKKNYVAWLDFIELSPKKSHVCAWEHSFWINLSHNFFQALADGVFGSWDTVALQIQKLENKMSVWVLPAREKYAVLFFYLDVHLLIFDWEA